MPTKKKLSPTAEFVNNLAGAFSKYPVSDDTKEIYLKKLTSWHLTVEQWDQVFDKLIDKANPEERGMPELHEIYPILRAIKSNEAHYDTGWYTFYLDGRRMAIRVINKDGEWVNAPVSVKDPHGNTIVLQKYPFKKPTLPLNAVKVMFTPDKPAKEDTEDYREAINEIVDEIPF